MTSAALLELQKRCWDAQPLPLPERDARGTQCDVRMFVGFKGIFPFLHGLHHGTGPIEKIGERMVDLLAQRSALFAEDHTATTDSLWFMLEQTEQRISLRTQETSSTTQMRIGALAAYGLGGQGLRSSALGNISRLYRIGSGTQVQLVVEIEKIGAFSEPLLLHRDLALLENFQDKAQGMQYALLALDQADAAQQAGDALEVNARILLPAHSDLLEGQEVVLKRVGFCQLVRIGPLRGATKTWRCHQYQVLSSTALTAVPR